MSRTLRLLLLITAAATLAVRPAAAFAPDPDSVWTEARRLSDARQFDAALALVGEALATHPDDVRLRWLQAGVAGWAGRPADAVALYEDLRADHPEMAEDLAVDLATQRIAAGDPSRALTELDAHLAGHPDDRNAATQRALALTYLERFDEAESAYRALLAGDPQDLDARLGLARVLNWRGEHRRAAELYEEIAASGVDDAEVWNGLAYARYWSGRSDLAHTPLDRSLALDPGNAEARALADRLAWERSPWLSADYEAAEDSDDLELRTAVLSAHQPIGARDVVSASWRHQETGGPPRAFRMAAVGAGHERIWSDALSSDLSVFYQYDGAGSAEHVLGEGNVTWRPSDRVRVDVGAARDQVLAGGALALDLRAWTATAGVDWRFAPRWLLAGAAQRHWYSDDNTAFRTRARLEYGARQGRGWNAVAKLYFEQLAAEDNPGHGYYAPEGYYELAPALEVVYDAPAGWLVGAEGRVGLQKENGSPSEALFGFSGRAEVPLGRALAFGVRLEVSDSNLSSASGYSRNALGAYLRGRF